MLVLVVPFSETLSPVSSSTDNPLIPTTELSSSSSLASNVIDSTIEPPHSTSGPAESTTPEPTISSKNNDEIAYFWQLLA